MAEVRYQDRYAQVRQLNIHNRSVCYWRNNLSIRDFWEERGWYVNEDEGRLAVFLCLSILLTMQKYPVYADNAVPVINLGTFEVEISEKVERGTKEKARKRISVRKRG